MSTVDVVITGEVGYIWPTVERELHLEAPILANDLTLMVKDVTPVLTGALQTSITGIANPPGDSNVLAWIFAEDGEQLITWNRIYVAYQEGPPQGLSTYTNPPRLMFQGTADGPGLGVVEMWALTAVSTGLDMAATGGGIPFKASGGAAFGGGAYGYA